jgi:hypothetical protein
MLQCRNPTYFWNHGKIFSSNDVFGPNYSVCCGFGATLPSIVDKRETDVLLAFLPERACQLLTAR